MKRIAVYSTIAAMALLAGWLANELRRTRCLPGKPEIASTYVSVRDLANQPTQYVGKLVSVRGILTGHRSGEVFLLDASRSTRTSLTAVSIYVPDERSFSPLPDWVEYASFCGNDRFAPIVDGLEADAIVTGTFDGAQLIPRNVLQLSTPSKQW
jgi:hypothetical protein